MTHKLTPDEMLFLGKIRECESMWLDEVKNILKHQYNARINAVREHLGCTCKTYGKGMNKKCKANEHIYNKIKYQLGEKTSKFYYEYSSLESRQMEEAIVKAVPKIKQVKPEQVMSWEKRGEWLRSKRDTEKTYNMQQAIRHLELIKKLNQNYG